MVGVPSARLGCHALALVLMASLHAQTAGWIADLGDAQLGEAAERALLELGESACGPLEKLFAVWNVATPRDVARLHAALRVVDLLGEPAAPLAPTLAQRLPATGPQLRVEGFTALGSLAPYARIDRDQIPIGGQLAGLAPADAPRLITAIVRLAARSSTRAPDFLRAPAMTATDTIFFREIAAEVFARSGTEDAVEQLRARLLDREGRATGWDQVRYNGIVVPIGDDFRMRAGSALVRLAPDDARAIVGHGCLALLHPHRTTRRESLRALVRFGPAVAEAVPELLRIAGQGDAELAADALKLLSLAGDAVGPHLGEIEKLQTGSEGRVAKLAQALAARLHGSGFAADPQATTSAIAAATAPPAANTTANAETSLRANPHQSLARLVEQFHREGRPMPDRVVEQIAQLGRERGQDERQTLSRLLAMSGEGWSAKALSQNLGGGDLGIAHARAYGVIVVGQPRALQELALFLDHDNVAVRLAAARQLAARHEEVATRWRETRVRHRKDEDEGAAEELQQRLLLAARADPPPRSVFQSVNGRFVMRLDLATELQATSAAALVDVELQPEQHQGLLRKVLPYDDAEVVALGVARWSGAVSLELLTAIANDARPEVGKAAAAELERRRAAK